MSGGGKLRVGKNRIEDTRCLWASLLFNILLSCDVLRLDLLSASLARLPGLTYTPSGTPTGLKDPRDQYEGHVSTIARIDEKGTLPDHCVV
jgi:hypothetical protein